MRTFTTSRGVTVEFQNIKVLLETLNAQYREPEPPTYEVETATGAREKHAHDATTLETEADKAAWEDYQQKRAAAENLLSEALVKMALLRGIKFEMPQDGAWVKEQQMMMLQIPTDPLERKLHYLTTEAFVTAEDYERLMAGVMAESGMPEEVLQQAEATFRGDMGTDAARETSATPERHVLADQPALRGNARRGAKRNPGHRTV